MAKNHGRKYGVFLLLILLGSCREFYDEEFEVSQSDATTSAQDTTYEADLVSTNSGLSQMEGTARIDVQDSEVNVDLNLDGIPANVIQLHYSYVSTPCSNLGINFNTDLSSTRTFTVSEVSTTDALANDLSSSGASAGSGDINLSGKSIVVKAFTNFSGTPSPTGTNEIVIACGQLAVSNTGTTTTTTIEGVDTTTTIDVSNPNDTTFDPNSTINTTTFP